jgi:hypothetical protein
VVFKSHNKVTLERSETVCLLHCPGAILFGHRKQLFFLYC